MKTIFAFVFIATIIFPAISFAEEEKAEQPKHLVAFLVNFDDMSIDDSSTVNINEQKQIDALLKTWSLDFSNEDQKLDAYKEYAKDLQSFGGHLLTPSSDENSYKAYVEKESKKIPLGSALFQGFCETEKSFLEKVSSKIETLSLNKDLKTDHTQVLLLISVVKKKSDWMVKNLDGVHKKHAKETQQEVKEIEKSLKSKLADLKTSADSLLGDAEKDTSSVENLAKVRFVLMNLDLLELTDKKQLFEKQHARLNQAVVAQSKVSGNETKNSDTANQDSNKNEQVAVTTNTESSSGVKTSEEPTKKDIQNDSSDATKKFVESKVSDDDLGTELKTFAEKYHQAPFLITDEYESKLEDLANKLNLDENSNLSSLYEEFVITAQKQKQSITYVKTKLLEPLEQVKSLCETETISTTDYDSCVSKLKDVEESNKSLTDESSPTSKLFSNIPDDLLNEYFRLSQETQDLFAKVKIVNQAEQLDDGSSLTEAIDIESGDEVSIKSTPKVETNLEVDYKRLLSLLKQKNNRRLMKFKMKSIGNFTRFYVKGPDGRVKAKQVTDQQLREGIPVGRSGLQRLFLPRSPGAQSLPQSSSGGMTTIDHQKSN